jgi:hypothetical protein
MPPNSEPVLVQPIVFGLKIPDTRPPFDILRRYVEGKDNDALLYVPPLPGLETDAEAADDPAHPAKRHGAQHKTTDEESTDETAETAEPEEEAESPAPEDADSKTDESEPGTTEEKK